MTLEGLIVVIIMVIVGIAGIAFPFLKSKNKRLPATSLRLAQTRDELITSYERVLATMRDLDDDYQNQKLHKKEYEEERAYWAQYGVRLLQLLEGNPTQDIPAQPAPINRHETELDVAVEEAIRNYRVALQSAEKS